MANQRYAVFDVTKADPWYFHVTLWDIMMCRRVVRAHYTIRHTIIGLHEVLSGWTTLR